ncbi:MAG: response regulator [Candidatus Omnitrophota bacterium]
MRKKNKATKILIVDDEDNVREVISYVLEEKGFITEEAKDGKEALKKISRIKPDAIILDIGMPGMDGFQACKRLRKNRHTQNIPIIFLSAQECATEFIRDMPGAAIEYIEKPFDLAYLLKRIDHILVATPAK